MLITFGMGFVSGVYLYFSGFVPFASEYLSLKSLLPDPVEIGLSIVGDAYGGCLMANSCPSFQLAADRSYRFRSSPDAEMRTGVLPEALLNTLSSSLSGAPLERYTLEADKESCESYVDGIDYHYTIVIDGEEYVIDTCTTALPSNSAVNQALTRVWRYFGTGAL